MKTRIYFLDNLRAFIILLVVIIHAAIVYAPVLENVIIVTDGPKSNGLRNVHIILYIRILYSGLSSQIRKPGFPEVKIQKDHDPLDPGRVYPSTTI